MEKLSVRIKECEELEKDNQNLKLEIKKLQVEKESETAKLLVRIKECEELEKVNRILKDRIKKLEDENDSEKMQLADEVDNLVVHNLTQGIAYNTEITRAKEKVGALISENDQLFDGYCEVAAQNATQQATNEEFMKALLRDATVQQSAPLTQKIKSMYARIKKRCRKVYMKEDYCYQTIQRQLQNKLEEERKQCLKTGAAKGKGIVEVVNIADNLPVPKKLVLKVPNNSTVLKLLAEHDRTKLRAAIENEDASTCLWYREGLDVTMHHAVEMLNEGDTLDNIIESFSDIKMRDQLLKDKDLEHQKAHIFEFNSWKKYVEHIRKTVDKKEREQGTSDPHFELLTPQYDWEIVSAKKSPQQQANSVDCGILTCLVMDCIINNEDIPSKVSKEEVRSFRAYILERLLNDGPNSYQLKIE
ncbi:hypothetical protein Vadar_028422 [Vaccinium darrowii]|uniref:Uncharacterized protein n=1 Tax=Vaccinium darrowii TaxID=229202 RepID=A0ACB7ZEQ8_9ERIC|nr:hypothetical protein Vadar_028422 [Vaccinium darrowii]